MLNGSLPVTLQYQLRHALAARIGRGEWQPGDRIPSERQLCEQYGVSRITARGALGSLERQGLVVRMRGRGTFVAGPKFQQELGGFYSFSEEIRKLGLKPQARLLGFFTGPCEGAAAARLGLAPGQSAHCIERLRFIGDDLFAWERSYVPHILAPGLCGAQVERLGLYGGIRQETGLAADEAEEEFEAVSCDDEAARLLGLRKGAAVLRLCRLTCAGGLRVEYCEGLIRGDKYKYKVILK